MCRFIFSTSTTYRLNIHFHIALLPSLKSPAQPSGLLFSGVNLYKFLISAMHAAGLNKPLYQFYPNSNITWEEEIMKLISYSDLWTSLTFNYSPQHTILKYPQSMFIHQSHRPTCTHTKEHINYTVYLNTLTCTTRDQT